MTDPYFLFSEIRVTDALFVFYYSFISSPTTAANNRYRSAHTWALSLHTNSCAWTALYERTEKMKNQWLICIGDTQSCKKMKRSSEQILNPSWAHTRTPRKSVFFGICFFVRHDPLTQVGVNMLEIETRDKGLYRRWGDLSFSRLVSEEGWFFLGDFALRLTSNSGWFTLIVRPEGIKCLGKKWPQCHVGSLREAHHRHFQGPCSRWYIPSSQCWQHRANRLRLRKGGGDWQQWKRKSQQQRKIVNDYNGNQQE